MKKKDLLGMMSFADEKYVKEADPDSAAKKHKKSRLKMWDVDSKTGLL